MNKQKLAVCTIFENEAPYLPEFLAYHRLVGVEHFVLYDNGSTDDPGRAIRGTSLANHVTLIRWPQQPGHLAAYRHFIDIYAPGFEWVAFLDVDEFLLPLNSRNVADTLDWLSNAAAVLVQRRVFGPETWQEPPSGLVIENYRQRAPDDHPGNRHVKTIARCSRLLDVTQNPNEFRLDGPVFNTAGHLAPNSAIQAQPCHHNLVINHYATRSRQDWLAKLRRNDAADTATTPLVEPGMFDHLAEVCRVQDTTIQPFAAAVRDLLGLDAADAPPLETIGPRPAVAAASPPGATSPAGAASPVGRAPPVESTSPMVPASPTVPTSPMAPASPPSPVMPTMPALPAARPSPTTPTLPTAPVTPAPPVGTESAVAPSTSAHTPRATEIPAAQPARPAPPGMAATTPVAATIPEAPASPVAAKTPLPGTIPGAVAAKADVASAWVARGQDAQERAGGLGLVFRDRSRAGEHWLAAMRGTAVAAIDPAFLLDEFDRIQEFPSDAEARAACEAALSRQPAH